MNAAQKADGFSSRAIFTSRGGSAAAWTLLLLVRFYITFLSPFFGGACRFHPSCSNYAAEAIARHGARSGLALALRRLVRCNPFTKGGFDPVPDEISYEAAAHLPRTQGEPFAPTARSQGGSQ
ncbi:MAG: membrane protein insertion efficiency factor YidD [Candidatus Acidiferrales bacterium]